MKQYNYKSSGESSASRDVLDTAPVSSPPAPRVRVDDDWLEAILDNLAVANLRRSDCVELIEHLEDWERADRAAAHVAVGTATVTQVVGDHFETEFNDCDMRSPDTMTGDNVVETIERAIRGLSLRGHTSAVRQIVFFVSANLDEVIVDADDAESTFRGRLPADS